MATVKPLDPIQGFVDYINDIKPYHTKIAEVLIEYQQLELVDVTIVEDLRFVIDMFRPDRRVEDGVVCSFGYDAFPYGGTTADIVTAVDPATDTFTVQGNRAPVYPTGSQITVFAQTVEDVPPLTVVPNPPLDHTGVFTVLSSTFVPGVNPFTTITVVEDFVDPIPALVAPFFYEIDVRPSPINIVDEIPYSNVDNKPFEEPDENQVFNIGANAFVIDGDFTSRFVQGIRFNVNTGKNYGTYTTLYSDFVGGQTRIRVIKDIKHISSEEGSPGGGQITEPNLGYEPIVQFCTASPESVQVVPLDSFVVDSVAFDWGATYFFDIIAVDDVLETVLLDGDFASILFPGDEVFIVGSDVNNGTYNIVSVTLNMITNETTVELDGDLDPSVTLGQLRIDLADIVQWFQYNIVDTNLNEFIVYGNATADLFPSQQFRVLGNSPNNGMYTALNVIYDGIHSTVVVADTLAVDIQGGVVESHRDQGVALRFGDSLAVTMTEEEVTALVTSGLTYGGWDADYWDVGAYDENLGTLILLYGGTFS